MYDAIKPSSFYGAAGAAAKIIGGIAADAITQATKTEKVKTKDSEPSASIDLKVNIAWSLDQPQSVVLKKVQFDYGNKNPVIKGDKIDFEVHTSRGGELYNQTTGSGAVFGENESTNNCNDYGNGGSFMDRSWCKSWFLDKGSPTTTYSSGVLGDLTNPFQKSDGSVADLWSVAPQDNTSSSFYVGNDKQEIGNRVILLKNMKEYLTYKNFANIPVHMTIVWYQTKKSTDLSPCDLWYQEQTYEDWAQQNPSGLGISAVTKSGNTSFGGSMQFMITKLMKAKSLTKFYRLFHCESIVLQPGQTYRLIIDHKINRHLKYSNVYDNAFEGIPDLTLWPVVFAQGGLVKYDGATFDPSGTQTVGTTSGLRTTTGPIDIGSTIEKTIEFAQLANVQTNEMQTVRPQLLLMTANSSIKTMNAYVGSEQIYDSTTADT